MVRETAVVDDLRRELGERLTLCRKAAGLTQERLAELTYCHRTKIAHVEKGRAGADERFWQTADHVLGADGALVRAASNIDAARLQREAERRTADQDAARRRLVVMADGPGDIAGAAGERGDELYAAERWLDERVGWPAGQTRQLVERIGRGPRPGRVRRTLPRSEIAAELSQYYGTPGPAGTATFAPVVGRHVVPTSVVTSPEWISSACPLDAAGDRAMLRTAEPVVTRFDDVRTRAAVRRIADVRANWTRITDLPIYRLLGLTSGPDGQHGEFGVSSFLEYALTMDLLETELFETVGSVPAPEQRFPLRDSYLPDLASVLHVSGRLCAGGVLSLCAIARPADPARGPADYALLVQQRSSDVLNAGGALAVIPKGIHGPLVDHRADVRIGCTLRRELEEELFGRMDLDGTEQPQRAADPMHRSRLSEPMRWLMDDRARMRMESTGFGLNLVSGNYEFACVTVIEDEEFWSRFGGSIVANWETSSLRLISSRDPDQLEEVVTDERWSNEGLFAFVLGLRRLREVSPDRVSSLPIKSNL